MSAGVAAASRRRIIAEVVAVSNVLVNGDFSAEDANWSGFWYSGKAVANGKAVWYTSSGTVGSSAAYDGIDQTVSLIAGKYYELQYTVSERTAGSVFAQLGGGGTTRNGASRNANGIYTERLLVNTGNTKLYFMPDTAPAGLAIDNVSLVGPYDTATATPPPSYLLAENGDTITTESGDRLTLS